MKTVNMGPAYTRRVTLRLTEDQFEFLTKTSGLLGVSPSDYLRMSVSYAMATNGQTVDDLMNGKTTIKQELAKQKEREQVGIVNENVKTDFNNLV